MLRAFLAFLVFWLPMQIAGAADAPDAPVGLRAHVAVDEPVVTLGDLFVGLPADKAQQPAVRAPAPGDRVVLEAAYLYRLARAYRIAWRPLHRSEQAVVERRSTRIDADTVGELITASLAEQGLPPLLELQYDRDPTLHLAAHLPATAKVARIDFDRGAERFSATLEAPSGHPEARAYTVSGRYYLLTPVPVPLRRINPGEVVSEADLEWVDMRQAQLPNSVAAQLDGIVGQAARRPLLAQRPILQTDLHPPQLIKRGTMVMMIYRTPYMRLSAKGRALQSGALGETVKVMNAASRKIVFAEVTGPDTVSVATPVQAAMN
jgi:flagella basal body P-ring formation protein FlgA